jgi:hypothetical protein
MIGSGSPTTALPVEGTSVRCGHVHYLIFVLALVDTFGGLVQNLFPASLVLRACLVVFLLGHLAVTSMHRQRAMLLWSAVLLYFVVRLLVDFLRDPEQRLLSIEGGATMKLLYFPLLYAYLKTQFDKGNLTNGDLRRGVFWYGVLVLASLLLGGLTGLGGEIGGRGVEIEGGKGFMIGANEVGLMLILTQPFLLYWLTAKSRSVLFSGLAAMATYALAGAYVFTKSSLISTCVAIFSAIRGFRKGRAATRALVWTGLALLVFFAVRTIVANTDAIEEFARNTFFSSLLNGGIISFLFRGRQTYIDAIFPQLLDHDMNGLFYLFGAGEHFMRGISVAPLQLLPDEGTTFEMDFFDLFAAYGLVGTVLYCSVVWHLIKRSNIRKLPADVWLAIICVLGHAFMAGHVLFSPQVTTIFALLLLSYAGPEPQVTPNHEPN